MQATLNDKHTREDFVGRDVTCLVIRYMTIYGGVPRRESCGRQHHGGEVGGVLVRVFTLDDDDDDIRQCKTGTTF